MKKTVLNTTGLTCRTVKSMLGMGKADSVQLALLWKEFILSDLGSMNESISLNGIASIVGAKGATFTHLLIPSMSNDKLNKVTTLFGHNNVIQHDCIYS